MPVARELGVEDVIDEHCQRVPYLDALQLLSSADGIVALGSTDHHYTASKIFPCILAGRPILSMFHEESTVCIIVRDAGAGELVTYSDEMPVELHVDDIASSILRIVNGISRGFDGDPASLPSEYSAERASAHVFKVLDRAVDEAFGDSGIEGRRAPAMSVVR